MAARRAAGTIVAMARASRHDACAPGLSAVMAVVLLVGPLSAPVRAQVGFDRPGADYASAVVRSGDPTLCAARCERDPRCHAWSFSYPETVAPTAVCQLKSAVTRSVPAAC